MMFTHHISIHTLDGLSKAKQFLKEQRESISPLPVAMADLFKFRKAPLEKIRNSLMVLSNQYSEMFQECWKLIFQGVWDASTTVECWADKIKELLIFQGVVKLHQDAVFLIFGSI